LTVETAKVTS